MFVRGKELTIVSRQSRLAMRQANIVADRLVLLYPDLRIQIEGITTSGDEILDQALNKIGGKGLFVKELEHYLLNNKADIAVHSMKDMPAHLPDGLAIGAILERADVRDVFVSEKYPSLQELPVGAVVGTSSLRRQAQILAIRPDVKVQTLRGNVETRLQKLQSGQYHAIILAAAGLERLGLQKWLQHPLPIDVMLPAVGQGALGIEYNTTNTAVQDLIAPLNDLNTAICVQAERTMNAILDGGCQAPIGALAVINENELILHGLVAHPDGSLFYQVQTNGNIADAVLIGEQTADALLAKGAGQIISQLKHTWQSDG